MEENKDNITTEEETTEISEENKQNETEEIIHNNENQELKTEESTEEEKKEETPVVEQQNKTTEEKKEEKPVKKERFKALKIIWKVLKAVLTVFLIIIFAVIIVQRVTNNKATLAGYGIYTVVSESMVPEYNIYDMLFAKKVNPEEIKIGDDVVYQGKEGDFTDKIVTHRVIKKRYGSAGYYFVTKGIANDIEDPEINQEQIYGKVMLKSKILSSISKVINTSYGFYFIIFVPLVVIITLEVIDTANERKRMKREQE